MDRLAEGWQRDPFGRHDERWMSAGTPTDLVRDGWRESHDAPTEGPPPEPPPKQHWIDVDRLERMRRRGPGSSTPNPRSERTRARFWAAVSLTAWTVLATFVLQFHFGPGFDFGQPQNPPVHLGRDETIGQVEDAFSTSGASGATYTVTYQAPGHPDPTGDGLGIALGSGPTGSVFQGQSAVVRYDPSNTTNGTVVALIPPNAPYYPSVWVVVGISWAVTLLAWLRFRSRRARGLPENEEDVDYRDDEWAGSTYSA